MKLVLKYYGSGMDGRDKEVCVPVEADSKKQVLDGLGMQRSMQRSAAKTDLSYSVIRTICIIS